MSKKPEPEAMHLDTAASPVSCSNRYSMREETGTLHELRLGSAEMMALPDGVKGVNHTAGAAAVRPECNITSSRRAVFSSRKANSIRASATLSKQG